MIIDKENNEDLMSIIKEENLTLDEIVKLDNEKLSDRLVANIYNGISKTKHDGKLIYNYLLLFFLLILILKLENSNKRKCPYLPSACLPVPNPKWNNFDEILNLDLCRIIRECNTHKCTATCFKYVKPNDPNPICRGHFPRKKILLSTINPETGNIELKRSDHYCNNYNPFISTAVRCNII